MHKQSQRLAFFNNSGNVFNSINRGTFIRNQNIILNKGKARELCFLSIH